jgi:predicted ATPase
LLAQSCYRRALATAERQAAKLFSLRAATDLAGLLHDSGRIEEAKTILQPVYNWFSGGWDYPDLQRARAMLDKLRA